MTLNKVIKIVISAVFLPFKLILIVLAAGIGLFEPELADIIADVVQMDDKFRPWKD